MSIKYAKIKDKQIKLMEELGVFVEEIKEKNEVIISFSKLNKLTPEPNGFEKLLHKGYHYFGKEVAACNGSLAPPIRSPRAAQGRRKAKNRQRKVDF